MTREQKAAKLVDLLREGLTLAELLMESRHTGIETVYLNGDSLHPVAGWSPGRKLYKQPALYNPPQ